ncbi:MAG: hypothetical protein ACXWQQ_09515 [Pseudobdellovibrio sp.]
MLAIALFLFLQSFFSKPKEIENTEYFAPPLEVKYLSAGYATQLSDGFWMRAVQDTGYCEAHISEGICKGKSWYFNIINLVVSLDDQFAEAYYYGGLSLSVMIKDIQGASIIFDKATHVFKYDWPMLYLAAYHALFEEKDYLKASALYLRAANNGAPSWVRLSAGKLAASGGNREAAQEILQKLIDKEENPLWIKSLKEKLESEEKSKSIEKRSSSSK